MGRKRFSPEQIIVKLREAEIIESKGLSQVEAKKAGYSRTDIDPLAQGIWCDQTPLFIPDLGFSFHKS